MAKLTWGQPKVEIVKCTTENIPGDDWADIAGAIKQGTATLSTEAGERTEALDEGGAVVDVRVAKNKYTFTFTMFGQRGVEKPIPDDNGLISDNYAVRLTPEDSTLPGFIINCASVTLLESWTSADGTLWEYSFSALMPGGNKKMLEPYTAGA